jgi:hypothetical protein
MSAQQGWDLAEFRCGRCGTTITATTEHEYVNLVSGHKANCPASATTKEAR